MDNEITREEFLKAAVNDVYQQLADDPSLEIEIDPELADFMGISFDEACIED